MKIIILYNLFWLLFFYFIKNPSKEGPKGARGHVYDVCVCVPVQFSLQENICSIWHWHLARVHCFFFPENNIFGLTNYIEANISIYIYVYS